MLTQRVLRPAKPCSSTVREHARLFLVLFLCVASSTTVRVVGASQQRATHIYRDKKSTDNKILGIKGSANVKVPWHKAHAWGCSTWRHGYRAMPMKEVLMHM